MAIAIKSVDRILFNGAVVAGCTRTVYLSGTTTKATIYSDAALAVPTSNPLTTDTNGEVSFYAANTSNLRFYDQAPDGTTLIRDLDPVYPVTALTGLNATTTELNYLNGVTPGTTTASKALVAGSSKQLDVLTVGTLSLGAGAGTAIASTATELNKLSGCTSSTAELNKLTGCTATTAELNKVAGVTAGTVTASKAVVVDATKAIDQIGITNLIDANGNAILKTASTASAVNQITVTNAATTGKPSLAASGTDANITAQISGKGTGGVRCVAPGAGNPLSLNTNANSFDVGFLPTTLTANRTITLFDTDIANAVVNRAHTETGALATGTTTVPTDDTIPQNTEGDQYMTITYTPKLSTNILRIEVTASLTNSASGTMSGGLFQDTTASAIATQQGDVTAGGVLIHLQFSHMMTAGTASATTFKFRAGLQNAGTTTFNGQAGARKLGGTLASSIIITEYAA